MTGSVGARRITAGFVAGVVATASCAEVCTLIGCDNGLRVRLSGGVPAGSLHVIASAEGQQPRSFDCPGVPCMSFLSDFTPAQVTITVESTVGSTTRAFAPNYVTTQPNGKDCDPTCRQAEVVMSFP